MKKYFKLGMCLKIAKISHVNVDIDDAAAAAADDDDDYIYLIIIL